MSTKHNYTRVDDFSLERSEIVKLDRDESHCNSIEAPTNLEACYQAYTESKVCSLRGITLCNKFFMFSLLSFNANFRGGIIAIQNTRYVNPKMITASIVEYTTGSSWKGNMNCTT